MTLLLIGHESPVRHRLIASLQELPGVEVVVLEPGADDIMSTMSALDPAAVLVEIQQAQAGGLRLIKALRGLKSRRPPAIIAFSSTASIQYRMKCHEAGATFFFDTAGDQELLFGALRSIAQEFDRDAGLTSA